MKYELEDPLICLGCFALTKTPWKQLITTKITAYYKKDLRSKSQSNSRMEFLNTNLFGLSGRQHPAIQNMKSSWEVKISRAHLKFLSGNYITYAVKAEQSGGSPKCRICNTGNNETLSHVILSCPSLEAERKPIMTEY